MSRVVKSAPVSADAVVVEVPIEQTGRRSRKGRLGSQGTDAESLLTNAKRQAIEMLERARRGAARTRREAMRELDEARAAFERAQVEADTIRQQAREQGYEEGFESGQQAGFAAGQEEGAAVARARIEAEMTECLRHLRDLAAQAVYDKTLLFNQSEAEVVELALAIAAKVIGREVEIDRSIVLESVRRALSQLVLTDHARIRVHPDDYALFADRWVQMEQQLGGRSACEVVPDPTVTIGGCIVDTKLGSVSALFETQLEELRETMLPDDNTSEADGSKDWS